MNCTDILLQCICWYFCLLQNSPFYFIVCPFSSYGVKIENLMYSYGTKEDGSTLLKLLKRQYTSPSSGLLLYFDAVWWHHQARQVKYCYFWLCNDKTFKVVILWHLAWRLHLKEMLKKISIFLKSLKKNQQVVCKTTNCAICENMSKHDAAQCIFCISASGHRASECATHVTLLCQRGIRATTDGNTWFEHFCLIQSDLQFCRRLCRR